MSSLAVCADGCRKEGVWSEQASMPQVKAALEDVSHQVTDDKMQQVALQILGKFRPVCSSAGEAVCSSSEPSAVFRPATVQNFDRDVCVITAKEGKNLAVYIFNPCEKFREGTFKIVHWGKRLIEEGGLVQSSEVAIAEPATFPVPMRQRTQALLTEAVRKRQCAKDLLIEEARLLNECKQIPGIVQPFNCVEESQSKESSAPKGPWMVFPFFNEGDLMDCYENLSPKDKIDICSQFLTTGAALEKEGLVHRDIKPENIVVHRNLDKTISSGVIDVSFLTKELKSQDGIKGSLLWLCPELACLHTRNLFYKEKHEGVVWPSELKAQLGPCITSKVDAWSFGMVLAWLLVPEVGGPLLLGQAGDDQIQLHAKTEWFLRNEIPGMQEVLTKFQERRDGLDSRELQTLIGGMLYPSPKDRWPLEKARQSFLNAHQKTSNGERD